MRVAVASMAAILSSSVGDLDPSILTEARVGGKHEARSADVEVWQDW
jgi:hypothetical protein